MTVFTFTFHRSADRNSTDVPVQRNLMAITGRNQVPAARHSERYVFSEVHDLAMASAGGGGGGQGETQMDYDALQNLSTRQITEEHEEYSHLQY